MDPDYSERTAFTICGLITSFTGHTGAHPTVTLSDVEVRDGLEMVAFTLTAYDGRTLDSGSIFNATGEIVDHRAETRARALAAEARQAAEVRQRAWQALNEARRGDGFSAARYSRCCTLAEHVCIGTATEIVGSVPCCPAGSEAERAERRRDRARAARWRTSPAGQRAMREEGSLTPNAGRRGTREEPAREPVEAGGRYQGRQAA